MITETLAAEVFGEFFTASVAMSLDNLCYPVVLYAMEPIGNEDSMVWRRDNSLSFRQNDLLCPARFGGIFAVYGFFGAANDFLQYAFMTKIG